MSVSGTDEKRAHECASVSVGLLISHPSRQQRCHVAEQIPALMGDSNLLPTLRAPLLAFAEGPQQISSSQPFFFP